MNDDDISILATLLAGGSKDIYQRCIVFLALLERVNIDVLPNDDEMKAAILGLRRAAKQFAKHYEKIESLEEESPEEKSIAN